MITPQDEPFLRRALRLAMNGRGHVEPNPMVGCVLVKNGQTIGEGWHEKFGGPHAEPSALADCKARGNSPEGSTAYVTLEPCCHVNKKTPPCAPRLIEAKISRVVIGCLDPNPDVNGNGVAMLMAAGIEVDALPSSSARGTGFQPVSTPSSNKQSQVENLCHEAFQQLIAPFIARVEGPLDLYLTLKWAESADRYVAGKNGARVQITNERSSALVQQLRGRSAAVLVGVNTVITDDPMLTVRSEYAMPQPARVVLDRNLRIPAQSRLLTTARDPSLGQVIILCSESTYRDSVRVSELDRHVEVNDFCDGDLRRALEVSAAFVGFTRHQEFLVEPGPTLSRALLPSADRLWVFRSTMRIVGGPSAPRAAVIPDHYIPTGTLDLAGDTLTEYLNTKSHAFFAAVPSADFVLAAESASSVA